MSFVFFNLIIRFILEITTLIVVGMWGWHQGDGWMRYVWAIGVPMGMSVIWGVFNVPGDISRSGSAPVVVHGIVRLLIELVFFACGAWAMMSLGYFSTGQAFIVVVVLHYAASFNRVIWLLNNGKY